MRGTKEKSRKGAIGIYRSPLFVSRKPRDSRVVLKRLTDEKKSSKYVIISLTCQSKIKTYLEDLSMKKISIDNSSLAHTSWNCKYHIVFAPKYRRKVFFEEKRLEIREILRQLCQWGISREKVHC